jgi:uncharacterized membrane protein
MRGGSAACRSITATTDRHPGPVNLETTDRETRDSMALGLAALLTSTGVLHFAAPTPFRSIVPRSLPAPGTLVAVSGLAELAVAGLLLAPRTRRIGGWSAAALFVAVFPANVSMALRSGGRPVWYRLGSWARLPLQAPLIVWALRIADGR